MIQRSLINRKNSIPLLILLCLFAFFCLPAVHVWNLHAVRGISISDYQQAVLRLINANILRIDFIADHFFLLFSILEGMIGVICILACYFYAKSFSALQYSVAFTIAFTILFSLAVFLTKSPLFCVEIIVIPFIFIYMYFLHSGKYLNPSGIRFFIMGLVIGLVVWREPVITILFLPYIIYILGSYIGMGSIFRLFNHLCYLLFGVCISSLPALISISRKCYKTDSFAPLLILQPLHGIDLSSTKTKAILLFILLLMIILFFQGVCKREKSFVIFNIIQCAMYLMALYVTDNMNLYTVMCICPISVFLMEDLLKKKPFLAALPPAFYLLFYIIGALFL